MKYKYTKQQAFDKVVEHLVEQGKPSRIGNTSYCSYLTPSGLRCAAGWLIDDINILKAAKKTASDWSTAIELIPELGKIVSPSFVQKLQNAHDQGKLSGYVKDHENWRYNWAAEMYDIAIVNKLNTTKLTKLATKEWRLTKI